MKTYIYTLFLLLAVSGTANALPFKGSMNNIFRSVNGVSLDPIPPAKSVLRSRRIGGFRTVKWTIPGTSFSRTATLPWVSPGVYFLSGTVPVYSQPDCFAEILYSITELSKRKVILEYTEDIICPGGSSEYLVVAGTLKKPLVQ